MNKIDQIMHLFVCPDDHSELIFSEDMLSCEYCKRKFTIDGNLIDFRPKKEIKIIDEGKTNSIYRSYYKNLIKEGIPGEDFGTFGLISDSISKGFVKETLFHLQYFLKKNDIVCDIGAGSGDYSIKLAKSCKIMLHCDLDTDGIRLAKKNAEIKKIDNIFFLICDYFKLPFKNKIVDVTYTIDIIERGMLHDRKVLQEMSRITKDEKNIIFDCHAKERSNLTRKHPDELSLYSKTDIKKLAKEEMLKVTEIIGTGFIPQIRKWTSLEYSILNPIAKKMLFPPARWLLRCQK
jgi:ubiquinone/menaquinone biosynthesis C-methylase UbiE